MTPFLESLICPTCGYRHNLEGPCPKSVHAAALRAHNRALADEDPFGALTAPTYHDRLKYAQDMMKGMA